jgi:hypothetical protein
MPTELARVLAAIPQAEPRRQRLPPQIRTAIGIDDTVYVYLTAVGDAEATALVIAQHVLVRELDGIVRYLGETTGLVYKAFPVETAREIIEQFQLARTEAVLLRPDRVTKGADGRITIGTTDEDPTTSW